MIRETWNWINDFGGDNFNVWDLMFITFIVGIGVYIFVFADISNEDITSGIVIGWVFSIFGWIVNFLWRKAKK